MVRDTYIRTCELNSQVEDKRLFWELLKMEIKATTIAFTKRKAKTNHNREKEIKRQLDELDDIICNNLQHPDIDKILDKYSELKHEFESIHEQKGKAAMFRSNIPMVRGRRTSNKIYLNIDKDTTVKDEKKILYQIESFYEELYSTEMTFSHTDYDEFIKDLKITRLSKDVREKCEGLLTFEECKKSLETFQNGKSPGEDGFAAEFYVFFFELLGHDLIASLNAAFELGERSISQRRGIITLLPRTFQLETDYSTQH